MDRKRITITKEDMLDALAKACTEEPLSKLVDMQPLNLLLFPIVVHEVWAALTGEKSEEGKHERSRLDF